MPNRIPAADSHTALADRILPRVFTPCFAFLILALALPVKAGRVVDMPPSQSFADAYQVALDLARQHPGSRLMTVASTYSMYPTLDWDSIVIIVPTSLDQIGIGDIVCFRDARLDGQHTILHRVEKILSRDRRLVTRGDNLDRPDPHPVGADALIGKAVYVVYFDRTGEKRPVNVTLPTPRRTGQIQRI